MRLNKTLDTIISQHDYPEPIGVLIAQCAVLTAMLASVIKFDSVFTLQVQGAGSVSMLAVDMTADGKMRGYSRFDEAAVIDAYRQIQEKKSEQVPAFFKEGTLSFMLYFLSCPHFIFLTFRFFRTTCFTFDDVSILCEPFCQYL